MKWACAGPVSEVTGAGSGDQGELCNEVVISALVCFRAERCVERDDETWRGLVRLSEEMVITVSR